MSGYIKYLLYWKLLHRCPVCRHKTIACIDHLDIFPYVRACKCNNVSCKYEWCEIARDTCTGYP